MKNKKILFVCAHPDDEVLGCGGIIAKYLINKNKIKIIFLSEGVTARFKKTDFHKKEVINQIKKRNNNCLQALNLLGLENKYIKFYNNQCCRLDTYPIIELTKIIEENINSFKPDLLFTHNKDDVNIDHQITYKATLAAVRPLKNQSVKELYTFETLSSTEWNPQNTFKPQVFENITDFIDLKIRAMKKYKNELLSTPHSRSIEKIKSQASYRGSYAGFDYAEAFMLIRSKNE
jgi:LmbE family N-acetylglucosaminyl deacetylase